MGGGEGKLYGLRGRIGGGESTKATFIDMHPGSELDGDHATNDLQKISKIKTKSNEAICWVLARECRGESAKFFFDLCC